MGRITDTIPALYHSGDNDLTRFTDILDSEVMIGVQMISCLILQLSSTVR